MQIYLSPMNILKLNIFVTVLDSATSSHSVGYLSMHPGLFSLD